MVPTQAIMMPQFELVARMGLIGFVWPVILPSASTALGVFLARQFFLSVPVELVEAARIDGCNHWPAFLRIVLPLARPLVAVERLPLAAHHVA